MTHPANPNEDLKRQSLYAGAWGLLGNILASFSGLLVFLVVTRLLSPEEVGLIAIVDMVIAFGLRVLSTGIAEPLVQFQQLSKKHIDTLFWTIQLLGILLSTSVILISPAIANCFGFPNLSRMLGISAIAIYLQAMVLVPQALLARDMRFDSVTLASIRSEWIATLIAIGAATMGAGVWAMITHRLVQAALFFVFIKFKASYVPQLQWSKKHFDQMIGFSASRLVESFVLYFDQNLPRFLLGYFVSPTSLGYFALARNITDSVLRSIAMPIRTIALSALAKVQSDIQLVRTIYAHGLSFTAGIMFPASVGIACIAPEIAEIFGSKWNASVLLLQILAIASMRNAFQVWNASVLRALGVPGALLLITTLRAVVTALASVLLLGFGVQGVCIAILISGLITSPLAMRVTREALGMKWFDQIKPAWTPLVASSLMAICILLVHRWFLDQSTPYFRLAVSVLLGCVSYLLSVFLIDRKAFQTWRNYLLFLRRNHL
jgi:PST family polysaccharide transporter